MILAVFSAVVLQTSTPADAGKPAAVTRVVTTADAAKTVDNANKKRCILAFPTGSNIQRRICKTEAEWDSEAAGAAEFVAEIQQNYGKNEQAEHSPIGLGPKNPGAPTR